MSDNPKIQAAVEAIGEALQGLSTEEQEHLEWLKKEIQEVAQTPAGSQEIDHRLEFCYGIIMAGDKIKNEAILAAARQYINAVEGS